jgi:hypothetical protein
MNCAEGLPGLAVSLDTVSIFFDFVSELWGMIEATHFQMIWL